MADHTDPGIERTVGLTVNVLLYGCTLYSRASGRLSLSMIRPFPKRRQDTGTWPLLLGDMLQDARRDSIIKPFETHCCKRASFSCFLVPLSLSFSTPSARKGWISLGKYYFFVALRFCACMYVCMYVCIRGRSPLKKVDRLIVYISLVIRVSTRMDFDMLFCIINSTVAGAYP